MNENGAATLQCGRPTTGRRRQSRRRPGGRGRSAARRRQRRRGAVDLARDFLWQERRPQTLAGAEHQIPRRRGVGTGDLLDDNYRRDRVDFKPIQRLRDVHPEQPRLVHRRQDLRRQSPLALALVAISAHERRDALWTPDTRFRLRLTTEAVCKHRHSICA